MGEIMSKPVHGNLLPLCIDLDGTLISVDVTWLSLTIFLRHTPWKIFHVLGWLLKGRAYLKSRLASHVSLDIQNLPYDESLLEYIQSYGSQDVYLVTAADEKIAQQVAHHLGVFKDVMASKGTLNLRAKAKADALVQKFGEKYFIYAGNSADDLHVWNKAAAAIPLNTNPRTRKKLNALNVQIIEIPRPEH